MNFEAVEVMMKIGIKTFLSELNEKKNFQALKGMSEKEGKGIMGLSKLKSFLPPGFTPL